MTGRIIYSIVVPVHNSSQSVKDLTVAIVSTFDSVVKSPFEIILVNDSPENNETKDALLELHKLYANYISIIHFDKNYGQFAATICGFQYASGDYIFTLDDDLQHSPEFIPEFLKLQAHAVVIGCFDRKKTSFRRRILSYLKHLVDCFLFNKPRSMYLSSYRMLRKDIAEKIVMKAKAKAYFPALLLECTNDIVNVNISHSFRNTGSSGYNFKKILSLFNLAVKTRFKVQKPSTLFQVKEVLNRNA